MNRQQIEKIIMTLSQGQAKYGLHALASAIAGEYGVSTNVILDIYNEYMGQSKVEQRRLEDENPMSRFAKAVVEEIRNNETRMLALEQENAILRKEVGFYIEETRRLRKMVDDRDDLIRERIFRESSSL
ncbi:cellulase family glycosylhydrolase [Bacillus subtilis]|uniref:cellulase family glycosylhydrolase n=1 Tax=Bacillus subtilis TaxID=1423 RepID=UPI0025C90470|nr:cellulase family glycosylhydrolase [Bacillus subtilis]GLI90904.1 hypothetical protein ANABIO4_42560 [Bacillus subtilis]